MLSRPELRHEARPIPDALGARSRHPRRPLDTVSDTAAPSGSLPQLTFDNRARFNLVPSQQVPDVSYSSDPKIRRSDTRLRYPTALRRPTSARNIGQYLGVSVPTDSYCLAHSAAVLAPYLPT